jgi:hypothetical protein
MGQVRNDDKNNNIVNNPKFPLWLLILIIMVLLLIGFLILTCSGTKNNVIKTTNFGYKFY